MQIEQRFELPVPPAAAWPAFHDIALLVECLPGASLTGPVEGGEVGSGLSLIVLFEIVPHYGRLESSFNRSPVASVTVHYRNPSDSTQRISYYNCSNSVTEFSELPTCHQFAASVAMFALLLKESKYSKKYSWNDAILLADQSHNPKDPLQAEFVEMIEKAKRIYLKNRKKR